MKQSISKFFNAAAGGEGLKQIAHLVIDVQAEFCDPDYYGGGGGGTDHTRDVSQHISTVVPKIRGAGVGTYWVVYPDGYGKTKWGKPEDVLYLNKPDAKTGRARKW